MSACSRTSTEGAGGSAPEQRAEAAGAGALLRNAPDAARIVASAETARAQLLPATLTGETLSPEAKLFAPGFFLDKSAYRLGNFKTSMQVSLLRGDASKRKSAVYAEHSELRSCMDEADHLRNPAPPGAQPAAQAAASNAASPCTNSARTSSVCARAVPAAF